MVTKRWVVWAMAWVLAGCANAGMDEGPATGGGAGFGGPPAGTAGTAPVGGSAGFGGDPSGTAGTDSIGTAGVGGFAGQGGAGEGGAGSHGKDPLRPIERAEGYLDLAPPLGTPLPAGAPGTWHSVVIDGTKCRDGSALKIFYRYGSSKNYFVFLEGGGVCYDDFFCPINPKNVNETVDGETVLATGFGNLFGAAQVPQMPRTDGIFKNDARNPVRDWSAVYVPYCSGDVYGGTRENATVPGYEHGGAQQFVGWHNMKLVYGRIVATFLDADKALLTGSSAGGVGSLMAAGMIADMLIKYTNTRGFVVSDSGPVFADAQLEPCLQKKWRALWGLDGAFPADCTGCFNADGGGIVTGLGEYLFKKYSAQDQVLGGLISSADDEIMALFFSKGLDNCVGNPVYPLGRFSQGLASFRDDVVKKDRFSTYFMAGSLHMHIFRPRFYEQNGVGMSIAEWLEKLLNNESVHVKPAGFP